MALPSLKATPNEEVIPEESAPEPRAPLALLTLPFVCGICCFLAETLFAHINAQLNGMAGTNDPFSNTLRLVALGMTAGAGLQASSEYCARRRGTNRSPSRQPGLWLVMIVLALGILSGLAPTLCYAFQGHPGWCNALWSGSVFGIGMLLGANLAFALTINQLISPKRRLPSGFITGADVFGGYVGVKTWDWLHRLELDPRLIGLIVGGLALFAAYAGLWQLKGRGLIQRGWPLNVGTSAVVLASLTLSLTWLGLP